MARDPLDVMDREVVHFVRLAESVRLGAAEAVGSTLDRSAYLLLLTVADERGMTATRLAEALHLDISTITRQVAPLLSAGLLDRVAGPGKGAMLRVTPAGARGGRRGGGGRGGAGGGPAGSGGPPGRWGPTPPGTGRGGGGGRPPPCPSAPPPGSGPAAPVSTATRGRFLWWSGSFAVVGGSGLGLAAS